MNEEEVWWSLTRSRRTDFGSRLDFFVEVWGGVVDGPAWDDDARHIWVVGSRELWLVRRASVVLGFMVVSSCAGIEDRR